MMSGVCPSFACAWDALRAGWFGCWERFPAYGRVAQEVVVTFKSVYISLPTMSPARVEIVFLALDFPSSAKVACHFIPVW